MTVNRAGGESTPPGHFVHGEARTKQLQRLARRIVQSHRTRQKRSSKGIIRENLPGIGLKIIGDLVYEDFAKLLEFPLAHATNARELGVVGRIEAGHLAKRDVGENDV